MIVVGYLTKFTRDRNPMLHQKGKRIVLCSVHSASIEPVSTCKIENYIALLFYLLSTILNY